MLADPRDLPVAGRRQPGQLGQVTGDPQALVGRVRAGQLQGPGRQRLRAAGQARELGRERPFRAGLSVAGLPSHQPPYWRQTVLTMNSGSS